LQNPEIVTYVSVCEINVESTTVKLHEAAQQCKKVFAGITFQGVLKLKGDFAGISAHEGFPLCSSTHARATVIRNNVGFLLL
jgi:hypothetical protein